MPGMINSIEAKGLRLIQSFGKVKEQKFGFMILFMTTSTLVLTLNCR